MKSRNVPAAPASISPSRAGSRAVVKARASKTLPQIYLGGVGPDAPSVFEGDSSDRLHGSRLKWFISTCLAGAVGVAAIGVVLFVSLNVEDKGGIVTSLETAGRQAMEAGELTAIDQAGLSALGTKSDMMALDTGTYSVQHTIHERAVQRRDNRDFITIKAYARVVASLAAPQLQAYGDVPPLDPASLYRTASEQPGRLITTSATASDAIDLEVVELIGGILPDDDGAELANEDVAALVQRAASEYAANDAIRPGILPDGEGEPREAAEAAFGTEDLEAVLGGDLPSTNVTTVSKTTDGQTDDLTEVVDATIGVAIEAGDSVARALGRTNLPRADQRAIAKAFEQHKDSFTLAPGMVLKITQIPSTERSTGRLPVQVSLAEGEETRISVARDDAGAFQLIDEPLTPAELIALGPGANFTRPTVYAGLYRAARSQGIADETVMQLLRIHAYEVDFRRRVQAGDSVELFFDVHQDDQGRDAKLGEVLVTVLTIGGQRYRLYRFRTPDGEVDYYDEQGNNAKKFLMRQPVRGDSVRFTSGYGNRRHPLLGIRRMHTGVDYSARPGTPIMAAGTGEIELAGRKGGYGNYIRIRHANGYKTAYAHMQRFAPGMAPGRKVRQGEVIGYVGNTGISSGPHLHYEVLVNNQFVDPLQVPVPQARQLKGRELADFQNERQRLDALMDSPPVRTRVAQASQ